jgi:hypothetical protein
MTLGFRQPSLPVLPLAPALPVLKFYSDVMQHLPSLGLTLPAPPVPKAPPAQLMPVALKALPVRLRPVQVQPPEFVASMPVLPELKFTAARIEGACLPLAGEMKPVVTSAKLRQLLELGPRDRLMKVSKNGTAEFIGDDTPVNMMDPETELRVVRPAVAS